MLVKFCKPQHNLLSGCNAIRFGTIEYYRNLDPSFLIADSEEGVETIEVNHVGSIPSDRETKDFLNSTGFFAPDMTIQGINFKRTFPNSYVWCCKRTDSELSVSDGSQYDPEYTSYYKIPNPNIFSQYLGNLLIQNIKRHNFAESAHSILDDRAVSELSSVTLSAFHGPVIYAQKKEGRINFGRFESYAPQIPPEFRPIFVKTSKYIDDAEYRFAFIFHHRQRELALPVCPDPVDVAAIPVA